MHVKVVMINVTCWVCVRHNQYIPVVCQVTEIEIIMYWNTYNGERSSDYS